MENKCAIIVTTYNRKKLLRENLEALLNQTFDNFDIYVIDNASTDGTDNEIKKFDDKRIKYYNTGKNLGGAGGFCFGMKKANESKSNYKYVWIMDDDSIPNNDALESLVKKAKDIKNQFSYLASLVYWTDGELFNMNIPTVNYKNKMDVKFDIVSKYKLMPIETASFVGCFINFDAIMKVGLPIAEFFIYGDDVEYTNRLKKYAPAYLDIDSIIIHKAPSNMGADLALATEDRIDRFYYQYRNTIYKEKKDKNLLKVLYRVMKKFIKIILKSKNHKLKRIKVLLKGTIDGMFFNPSIEFLEK